MFFKKKSPLDNTKRAYRETLPHEDKYISLIVMYSSRDSLRINIPLNLLYWAGGFLSFILLIGIVSVFYSSHLSGKLMNYDSMKAQTSEQNQLINTYAQQSQVLQEELKKLEQREKEIRKTLGLSFNNSSDDWLSMLNSKDSLLSMGPSTQAKTEIPVSELFKQLGERTEELNELEKVVAYREQRLSNTPSIQPAFGIYTSGFGYRYLGKSEFHTGQDIANFIGTPIKATADGKVIIAGWNGNYGRMIKIWHGNEYTTLYGHCSKLLVSEGDYVKKGQIIALMGSTGRSTGSHVHYEIEINGTKTNPRKFFNLNLTSVR